MLFDFLGLYPYYGHKFLTWNIVRVPNKVPLCASWFRVAFVWQSLFRLHEVSGAGFRAGEGFVFKASTLSHACGKSGLPLRNFKLPEYGHIEHNRLPNYGNLA